MNSNQSIPHSFNDLALRYVASHASTLSQAQLNSRLDHLGQHVLGYFGLFKMTDITPTRVQKFIYHLELQGLNQTTINRCLVSFRACMKYALQQKWPVPAILSRPVVYKNEMLVANDNPHLTSQEFTNLYQDLVQDISKDMFH